ncbi:hypothetical protein GOP47_0001317 [Adiantum capillus-veneris]|uniref:Uncharacterized protein n=1 Tax=Adiantum capillus-veneris TaxID=13818 RepID=A0A9D4V8P6_ADICA|nr:hypothetical protein GOP47_0001317 [Adiantum capillus-veneris]
MAQKRHFRDGDTDDNDAEEKRQCMNLQSVVLEAVRANAMQKFWVVLEPMLRRVVSEEVERVISKYLPPGKLGSRLPSKQLQGLGSTSLRLHFQNKLALPLYTGSRVDGEHGNPIQVTLQDAVTGEAVIMEDESLIKLDIVVLEGDFSNDEEEDWTYEEFENHVVKERDGKRPLLTGDLTISLKEGMGILGELIFTDNSSWIRSRKFKLGVRLLTGSYKGVRVREAITEAFFVKDHRGQLYKKHYPPNLSDDVWRLEKIGKDGAYHKRLSEVHVNTVKDFLVMYATGPSRLREIFGTTMSTKTWDSILEHAKTTILNDTQYVYYPNDNRTIGVILNTIYQPLGILRNGSYVPVSSLSDAEQVYMERLVQEAHKDSSSLRKLPATARCEELNVASGSGHTRLVHNVPSHMELSERQQLQSQRTAPSLFENNSATLHPTGYSPSTSRNDGTGSTLATGLKKPLYTNAFSPGTLESLFVYSNHPQKEAEPTYEDIELYQSSSRYLDDYNHGRAFGSWGGDELLMLSGVSSGPISSALMPEDAKYSFSRIRGAQNPVFDVDHLHRRAYMGWLKLKAVLKFSFFMKKGVASRRRLQIEQLN